MKVSRLSCSRILASFIVTLLIAAVSVPKISYAQPDNIAKKLAVIADKKASMPEQALHDLQSLASSENQFSIPNKIKFYHLKSEILCDLAKYQACKEVAAQGLKEAKLLNRPSEIMSELYYHLGFAYESLGDLSSAEKYYVLGLDIAKSLEQPKQIAYGLTNIGAIYYQTHKEDLSLVALHDALAIAETANDQELLGYIYGELGILYGNIGESEQSIIYYEKSYETYLAQKNYIYAYNNARNLGINYANMGEYEKAIAAYKNIIDNQDKIKNPELIFSAYNGTATAMIFDDDEDNDEMAYEYLINSEKFLKDAQQHSLPIQFLVNKAYVLHGLKRFDQALDVIAQAEAVIQPTESSYSAIPLLQVKSLKAFIQYDLGHFEEAYHLLEQYMMLQMDYQNARKSRQVSEIRMQYEAAQAELKNQILTQQADIERIEVAEANRVQQAQKKYFLYLAVVALIFSWLLYRIIRGQRALIKSSRNDSLTQLANRRFIIKQGNKLVTSAKFEQQDLSVVIFKCHAIRQMSLQASHIQRDRALVAIADEARRFFRAEVLLGRLSGEEFIAILPNTYEAKAIELSEKFNKTVVKCMPSDAYPSKNLDIGIASLEQNSDINFEELLLKASQCLHRCQSSKECPICSA